MHFKKIGTSILILSLLVGSSNLIFADELTTKDASSIIITDEQVQPVIQEHENIELPEIQVNTPENSDLSTSANSTGETIEPRVTYEYYWAVRSVSSPTRTYGTWMDGPSGDGVVPGGTSPLSLSISRSSSNLRSGTIKIPIKTLDATVGYNTSSTVTTTASYGINVPYKQKWQIKYRRMYDRKTVTQQQKKCNMQSGTWIWYGTQYQANTSKFINFDYTAVRLK